MALESLSLNQYPELRPFIGPDSTPQQRLIAARGLAPLAPVQLATLLFLLTQDSDAAVAEAAARTFAEFPPNIKSSIASDPQSHPAVLHYLAGRGEPTSEVLEKLVLNPAADDRTLAAIAGESDEARILEIISHNQIRLARYPMIANHLMDNEALGLSHRERIRSYVEADAHRAPIRAAEPAAHEPEAAETVEEGEDADGSFITFGKFWKQATKEVESGYRSFIDDELIDDIEGDENSQEKQEQIASVYKLILTLKTSQKIKLAITGNKEARSILVKDSNKLVSTSVIKNPRLTDSEVVGISNSRSISEDILRMVAANKEWVKIYQIKNNLANNPKCPIPIALRIINVLNKADIQSLTKNKNISAAVQTAARRRLQTMDKTQH